MSYTNKLKTVTAYDDLLICVIITYKRHACSFKLRQHISPVCVNNMHCVHNGDSDLEAFNRNHAHGGIAVLAHRLAAFTSCVN